jgi:hypothetical protein
MEQMIEHAAPDEVVLLPNFPDYVNILISGVTTWNASDSLLGTEAFVIPVIIAKKPTIKVLDKKIPYRCPAVELGFAIIYHKLQGKTLDCLILDLNKRGCQSEVNLMSLPVGLSQVRQSIHVRILPPFQGLV